MKDYIDTAHEKKIVLFYDDFKSDHGETVVEIFTSSTQGEYSILKIDDNRIRVEALELIVDHLKNSGKEIYLNVSIQPNDGFYGSIFANTINRISKSATITQAIGNNECLSISLSKFTGVEKAVIVDREIYEKLSERVSEIRKISEDENVSLLISNFGVAYGALFYNFIDHRDDKMRELVKEVIHPILGRKSLSKHENEIVELYAHVLIRFSYSVLLQKISDNENLVVVSSSSQFTTDPTDAYFLDCQVYGLLKNVVRFPGVWMKEKKQIFGTSISAPLCLSAVFSKKT